MQSANADSTRRGQYAETYLDARESEWIGIPVAVFPSPTVTEQNLRQRIDGGHCGVEGEANLSGAVCGLAASAAQPESLAVRRNKCSRHASYQKRMTSRHQRRSWHKWRALHQKVIIPRCTPSGHARRWCVMNGTNASLGWTAADTPSHETVELSHWRVDADGVYLERGCKTMHHHLAMETA